MNEIAQLRIDLQWLAKRYKIIEDAFLLQEEQNKELINALQEWSESVSTQFEFMFKEFASVDIKVHKQNKSFRYFKESLKDKFKGDYEKFESLFLKIQGSNKKRREYKPYS